MKCLSVTGLDKASGSDQDGKQQLDLVSLCAQSKFDENLTQAGALLPDVCWIPTVRFSPWFLFQLVPPRSLRTYRGKAFHSSFTVLSHAPEICLCARTWMRLSVLPVYF